MTGSANADLALIERQACLRQLTAMLDEAKQGHASVAVLSGRCGNGQFALLRHTMAAAADRDMPVLTARAGHADRGRPFAAAERIVTDLTGGRPFDAGVADSAPQTGAPPGLHEAVAALRDRPALLVIRDSRWLDDDSRGWLRSLARRLPGLPVAVMFGGLHMAEEADWLGVQALRDQVPVNGLELLPLTAAGVSRLVEMTCGVAPDDEFAASAARLSAGSPDVLNDMLRVFHAGRRDPVAAQVPALTAAASSAWAEHTDFMLRELPPAVTAVLRALTVCDGLLDLPLVYALVEPFAMSAARMRSVLESCGLTASAGDRLTVVAPQVGARLLDGMSAEVRGDLYARAAELAHRAGADDEQVAGLLLRARPVGARWAVHRLRQSSAALYRRGSYDRARAHLSRALTEPLRPELRAHIGVELAGVEAVDAPEASDRRLADIAQTVGTCAPRTVLRAVDLCLARGDADQARRAVLQALARTGAEVREDLIALGALADELRSHPAELAVPAMPVLPERPSAPAQAGVRAWSLAVRGVRREAARTLARAALRSDADEVMPRLAACRALMLADELTEAAAGMDRLARGLGGGHAAAALGRVLAARAECHLRRGRLDLAARDAHDAQHALPPTSWHPLAVPQLLTVRILIEVESGREQVAAELAAGAVPAGAEEGPYWPFLLFARALTALMADRAADAAAVLQHCGRAMVRQGWLNPALLPWRSLAMEAAVRVGDLDRARSIAAEEAELAGRWGAPGAIGWAEVNRLRLSGATVAGGAPGGDDMREAVSLLRRSPGRLMLGWAMAELAHGQFAHGDREAALHSLTAAEEVASSCPAGRLAQRLNPLREPLREVLNRRTPRQALAASAGAPDRLLLHPAWAALSESDRITAMLAGRGNRNRHIATLLSVSERTVELRLSRVYKAMRLGGRTELRALIQAAGSG
ncbi:hypothetical protein [Mangrovihabitans endophyticus]|uniref:HTH luxR-type domain-containing protein n=1 Tax=Mangrovihabitans endophyticus TaxID=1751298 RepID=A0A8J3FSV3_9ACTN|nr:hypothetical protein [Mangrovihabitans endophyticus]GGL19634.1 hypothetical protein GCM10012284_62780 [Mangrovihabitans endophyticus]